MLTEDKVRERIDNLKTLLFKMKVDTPEQQTKMMAISAAMRELETVVDENNWKRYSPN